MQENAPPAVLADHGVALLATLPVAITFVTFQRYFVRDANEGADRG